VDNQRKVLRRSFFGTEEVTLGNPRLTSPFCAATSAQGEENRLDNLAHAEARGAIKRTPSVARISAKARRLVPFAQLQDLERAATVWISFTIRGIPANIRIVVRNHEKKLLLLTLIVSLVSFAFAGDEPKESKGLRPRCKFCGRRC